MSAEVVNMDLLGMLAEAAAVDLRTDCHRWHNAKKRLAPQTGTYGAALRARPVQNDGSGRACFTTDRCRNLRTGQLCLKESSFETPKASRAQSTTHACGGPYLGSRSSIGQSLLACN